MQQELGADIGYYDADGLVAKFPWLNTSDLAAGCHGLTGEGWFDGYGLMQAFRKKARSLGVDYSSGKAAIEREAGGLLVCAPPRWGHCLNTNRGQLRRGLRR
jgi:FAD-dependent oxidoreductase domain-containing protein 1